MALDPRKLSRDELVQLLNSTSLGECLTRGRLASQMNRAGLRWQDGHGPMMAGWVRFRGKTKRRPGAKQRTRAREIHGGVSAQVNVRP